MKIAITGSSGFVGAKLMGMKLNPEDEIIRIPSLRSKDSTQIERAIKSSGADVLIHTAAMSDIKECENNPEASYEANVLLPVKIAKFFEGKKLIMFSSDQVYSGSDDAGPYEEAMVCPSNLYSREKLEMEERVMDICPAVFLRAEWMYDFEAPKGNYFLKVLREKESLSFSSAQYRGVTYLKEVVENMPLLFDVPVGAYNFGSETTENMYEITKGFLCELDKDIPLYDRGNGHNLWMNCDRLKQYGISFSTVSHGLSKCLEDYKMSISVRK